MKKFILRTLLFIFPLLIFILFAEIKLSSIPTTYEFWRNSLEDQLNEIELLVLGNSQAACAINPDFLTVRGYNLGNVSQTLYYDTEKTLKYLSRMPRLKYVLINISYFSFWHILEDSHESWRTKFYYKYWNIKPEASSVSPFNKYSNLSLYGPRTALKRFFEPITVEFYNTYFKNGWGINDTIRINKIDKQESLAHQVFIRKHFLIKKRIATNIENVEKLLISLTKKGIRPIFISTPMPEVYFSILDSEVTIRNNQIIDDLCKQFDCDYYNYSNDKRFIRDDFIDVNHLNFIGAEKFSKIINQEIILDDKENQ